MTDFALIRRPVQLFAASQDLTVPGFGPVAAAFGLTAWPQVAQIGQPTGEGSFCVSLWAPDGPGAMGGGATKDQTTMTSSIGIGKHTQLIDMHDHRLAGLASYSPIIRATGSPITDGMRLDYSIIPTVEQSSMAFLYFGGNIQQSASGIVEMGFTGAPWDVDLGWRPDLVFALVTQNYRERNGPNLNVQVGAAVDDGQDSQFFTSAYAQYNQSISENRLGYYRDAIWHYIDPNTGDLFGETRLVFTPTGFRIEVLGGLTFNTNLRYLAVNLRDAGLKAEIHHLLTAGGTIAETIPTPGLRPRAVITAGGTHLTPDGSNWEDGWGWGMSLEEDIQSASIFNHYRSNVSGTHQASTLFDNAYLHWQHPTTADAGYCHATVTAMRDNEYDLDWKAAQRTQYPYAALVIGDDLAPPPATVRPRFWIT